MLHWDCYETYRGCFIGAKDGVFHPHDLDGSELDVALTAKEARAAIDRLYVRDQIAAVMKEAPGVPGASR